MRVFYGWIVVLITALGGFVVAGAGYAAFGQFIAPLSHAFGWSVGVVAFASTARLLVGIAAAPLIGSLVDRAGPRAVLTAGALITGAAYLALGWIADPVLFYLVFTAGLALGFQLLSSTPAQAAVTRWFRRRRGMALAFLSMGNSFGGVAIVPLVQVLLEAGGWRFAFTAIGAGVLCLLVPLTALAMRDTPQALGLQPDGDDRNAPTGAPLPAPAAHGDERAWSGGALWKSPDFRAMSVGFLFGISSITLIEVFQFPILTSRGLDGATAAVFISIYSLCAGVSKFGWGYLSDRGDLRRLLTLAIWLNAAGLALLSVANHPAWFWVFAVVAGTTGGGQAALMPALIAQRFGWRSYGTVAGTLMPLTMIAPALAVPLAGFVFDSTGGYVPVFATVAALAMLTSLSLLRVARHDGRRAEMAAPSRAA